MNNLATETSEYKAESVGTVMSIDVPRAQRNSTLGEALKLIAGRKWDDVQYVYVLDKHKLAGMVDVAKVSHEDKDKPLAKLMEEPTATLKPGADREKAVILTIKGVAGAIPVVDKDEVFLGSVTARTIIDIMHKEHLEDALLGSGVRIRGLSLAKLVTAQTGEIFRARAPWLILGAVAGLGLGIASSFFEETLQENVALAYFVPVVAYIANSVGTQTQAITIRALAMMKLSPLPFLLRELLTGVTLGAMLGVIGGLGAIIISRSPEIGLVVAVSLVAASTIASVLAAAVPIFLKALGKDPALGSGPLATAMQDILSVLIYFACALTLLG